MKELSRYEKELARELEHLSLPDKDQQWDEMKQLLDENDNKVVPPPSSNKFLRRVIYACLLLLGIAVCCWIYTNNEAKPGDKKMIGNAEVNSAENSISKKENQPDNSTQKFKDPGTNDNAVGNDKNKMTDHNNDLVSKNIETINKKIKPAIAKNAKRNEVVVNEQSSAADDMSIQPSIPAKTNNNKNSFKKDILSREETGAEKNAGNFKGKASRKTTKGKTKAIIIDPGTYKDDEKTEIKTLITQPHKKIYPSDSSAMKISNAELASTDISNVPETQMGIVADHKQADTSKFNQREGMEETKTIITHDTLNTVFVVKPAKDTVVKNEAAKRQKDQKKQPVYFAIGISVQQAIKTRCRCEYAGNTYKNRPAVKDYIPSVYLRYYSKKKWFAQAEFKYAAPQYVREFLYDNQVNIQPFNYISRSSVLKRTYFHELSLSFNYFILPHLSTGIGLKYNIFSSASSQVDLKKKLYGIGKDSVINSKTTTGIQDTGALSFYNNTSVLFEMQYKWKRFSLGAKYAIGLQPYVKYTDPVIKSAEKKKANSFNIFLRYDLWQLKNK